MNARLVCAAAAAALLTAAGARGEEAPAPAGAFAIAETVKPSVVRVEYELQFDKGEAPKDCVRCPGCGQYHAGGDEVIEEERPLEMAGFALSPTQVLTPDLPIHSRFIKSIAVRFGDQRVGAKIAALVLAQQAAILELAEPLKDAKPLAFADDRKAQFSVVYDFEEGVWGMKVAPMTEAVLLTDTGRKYVKLGACSLAVDKAGAPVGLSMRDKMPVDFAWKGSPLQWPAISADGMSAARAKLKADSSRGLLRVKLNFRSPTGKSQPDYSYRRGESENATEQNVVGVLLDDKRILVLASLKPKTTARLERIAAYPPQGKPVPAKYASALADYGCFVATLERPIEGAMKLSAERIIDLPDTLLLSAKITLHGEKRVVWYGHNRINSFEIGRKRAIYPNVPDDESLYLFDTQCALLALPVAPRPKVAVQGGRYGRGEDPVLTPVAYLQEALADPAKGMDPGNVPLGEAEENRLAWLGVELQPLDRELARANNVSDQTRDGEMGALVSYVYPDSPAGKAGIQTGYVLLRLHVPGQPAPLEVGLGEYGSSFGDEPFPWDRLEELPEEYFDQIPRPWPPAENNLTRALTDIGFGKKFTAEFFHDGNTINKDLEITQSVPYFDSAPRYACKPLGLTLRDMTYEVRRYFQRKPDDPGVIISKIERGSKASVAGIKPFEIITHVNDTPVLTVKDFERLMQGQEELRLNVKRMTRDRVVKIKLAAAAENKKPVKPEKAE